ncbi:MAG: glycosyltransferase [Cellulomonadaceae bacterium]|jgi:glycosyltransferase involved in cell wall biosynthesis|nr:glycosyltransferase [Cellulomonadaceae bacterium]
MSRHIYIMGIAMSEVTGGVGRAMRNQAEMFLAAGHKVSMITFSHYDTRETIENVYSSGDLPRSVEVLNPNVDMVAAWAEAEKRNAGLGSPTPKLSLLLGLKKLWNTQKSKAPGESASGSSNATHVVKQKLPHGGEETTVLTEGGNTYLVRRPYGDSGTEAPVQVFHPDGQVSEYPSVTNWRIEWLESVFSNATGNDAIVVNYPTEVPLLARANVGPARKLWVIHNNVWDPPYCPGSEIRSNYRWALKAHKKIDVIVTLTDQQEDDIKTLLGRDGGITTVNNITALPPLPSVDKDVNLVSLVGRLVEQKAVHESIEAFALIAPRFPQARFEIYGRGSCESDLKKLVKQRDLERQITFKGFTTNPRDVMARSVCTVSSSLYEGQPLNILESNAMATPVAAYDCRYGPSGLIEDGVTGRIVPQGDRQALANAIADMLGNPTGAAQMGTEARHRIEQHNTAKAVTADWEKAFSLADHLHQPQEIHNGGTP